MRNLFKALRLLKVVQFVLDMRNLFKVLSLLKFVQFVIDVFLVPLLLTLNKLHIFLDVSIVDFEQVNANRVHPCLIMGSLLSKFYIKISFGSGVRANLVSKKLDRNSGNSRVICSNCSDA